MSSLTHRWVLDRLHLLLAGLLGEADERQLRAHVARCSECRSALENLEKGDGLSQEEREHIPAGILATWDQSKDQLEGLERDMIRKHLDRCEMCRESLTILGHEPRLEMVQALEIQESRPRADTRPLEDDADRSEERPLSAQPKKNSWLNWTLGGWAIAATAAAVMLAVQVTTTPSPQPPTVATPGSGTPDILLIDEPLALRSPTRGGEIEIPVAVLARDTRRLAITAPPLDVPDGSRVVYALVNESGAKILTSEFLVEDTYPNKAIVLVSDVPFQPGRYALELTSRSPFGSILDEARYTFEIRVRGSTP